MSAQDRRAAARRRAWGRGPTILRFEPLEGRQLLSIAGTPAADGTGPSADTTSADATALAAAASTTVAKGPDLVATAFQAPNNLDWGDKFLASGVIKNQGDATATKPYHVDVYASASTDPGADDVKVGTIELPAGLVAGGSAPFSQSLQLPSWPIAGLGSSPSFYLTLRVDPDDAVGESNTDNNVGFGAGSNWSVVTVVPRPPADLSSGAFAVTPSVASWGGTVTVSARIGNDGAGDAPATKADVVLTPFGLQPGGARDVTIGRIDVPAIASKQTADVAKAITLPSKPPFVLDGTQQFVISLVLDADHQTTLATRPAAQGFGIDQAPIQIAAATGVAATPADKLPDLSLASVQGPAQPVSWGQSFQVATTVQNGGHADVGPFKVRFALLNDADPSAPPLALADATVPGLQAGYQQAVTQTIDFPGKLPDGLAPGSVLTGHVLVQIDPDHTIDRPSDPNANLFSGPITLKVVGTDGQTTPVVPPAGPVVTPTPTPPPSPTPTPPATPPPTTTPVGGGQGAPAGGSQPTGTPGTATGGRRRAARNRAPAHRVVAPPQRPHPAHRVVVHKAQQPRPTFPRFHLARNRVHALRVFGGPSQGGTTA